MGRSTKRHTTKRLSPNPSYKHRNQLLRELGYDTYLLYLQSDLWKAIRSKTFSVYGRNCRLCPRKATVIHHISYGRAVLVGQDLTQLAPLCRPCHNHIELHKGRKRKLQASQAIYKQLLLRRAERLAALACKNANSI